MAAHQKHVSLNMLWFKVVPDIFPHFGYSDQIQPGIGYGAHTKPTILIAPIS